MSDVTPVVDMKETSEVIGFLEGLAEAIKGAEEDKTIDWKDAKFIPHLGMLAKDAVIGSDGVLSEFKNANGEQREKALADLVKATMSLVEAAFIIIGRK